MTVTQVITLDASFPETPSRVTAKGFAVLLAGSMPALSTRFLLVQLLLVRLNPPVPLQLVLLMLVCLVLLLFVIVVMLAQVPCAGMRVPGGIAALDPSVRRS